MGPLVSLNKAGIIAALKSTSRLRYLASSFLPCPRRAANNGHNDIRHVDDDRMQFTQSAYDAKVCLILDLALYSVTPVHACCTHRNIMGSMLMIWFKLFSAADALNTSMIAQKT